MEKNYKIKIYYTTGDTFGSEDRETELEIQWDDLNIAKENLLRIEEHYNYYEKIDNFGSKTLSAAQIEDVKEEMKTKPWACVLTTNDKHLDDFKLQHCIKLKEDDGSEYQMSCFWTGYFEQLNHAEIITNNQKFKISF